MGGYTGRNEKVKGTRFSETIHDGLGKAELIGGKGADKFYFSGREPFKRRLSIR